MEGGKGSRVYSSRKGSQWFFGRKAHIGVDQDSGLIHSVATTGANVHNVTMGAELFYGEERVVYGDDAGDQGLEKREKRAGGDVECSIAMRPGHAADCLTQQKGDCWTGWSVLKLMGGLRWNIPSV